jgi:hypothetical protein
MAGMARGYSSELQTASLYKTNEDDARERVAHSTLAAGDLRKSDTLIDMASPLTIGVSGLCGAVC